MNRFDLVKKGLRHDIRGALGVVLGAAIGSAILVGALVVGDCIRASLRAYSEERLGQATQALSAGDRFFRAELAQTISDDLQVPVAPVSLLSGSARAGSGPDAKRAYGIQAIGVDAAFWSLALEPTDRFNAIRDGVVLNQRLATRLEVEIGDTVRITTDQGASVSRDTPISPQEDASQTYRLEVQGIATNAEFGRFSLYANQIPPFNAFIPIELLERPNSTETQANLLLFGKNAANEAAPKEAILQSFKANWSFPDVGLELRSLSERQQWDLRSHRVFMADATVDAVQEVAPSSSQYLTYLVTTIRSGDAETPYSMIAAGNAEWISRSVADNELIATSWLAEDLELSEGDPIEVEFLVPGDSNRLESKSATFTAQSVVPFAGQAQDPELMPPFPGVEEAESASDWDTGFDIDLDRIRDKDETYWENYRGAPKAFIGLSEGQRLWANRFGSVTSIRFPIGDQSDDELRSAILEALDPQGIGFTVLELTANASKAVSQSFDFGQLFLGFSFFLIIAALALVGLLFQFNIERRVHEVGLYLAVGFHPSTVRRLLIEEGVILSGIGSILGAIGGLAYARLMLLGLGAVWRQAVGASDLRFAATPGTILIGVLASIAISAIVIWLTTRKQANVPAVQLLSSRGGSDSLDLETSPGDRGFNRPRLIGFGCLAAAFALVILGNGKEGAEAAGYFFGAGSLTLIGALALIADFMRQLSARADSETRLSRLSLAIRNVTRRSKRSVTVIACIACGAFMVIGIEPFRLDAQLNADDRSSGTGGFELFGQSAIGVTHDLNTEEGRAFYALDDELMEHVRTVSFRLKQGEDASCLNLNRAQRPQVWGAPVSDLAELDAFQFSSALDPELKNAGLQPGWEVLNYEFDDPSVVPAIMDIQSLTWALGLTIGDELTYTDESGQTFKLRFVAGMSGSVLQGAAMISEENFKKFFPSVTGFQRFLIDAKDIESTQERLSFALENVGLDLEPTVRRLNALNQVQNTYLSTFQALGGLGLVLGSLGLAIVVLRNTLERRGELSALQAIGFNAASLRRMLTIEHGALLVAGLAVGALAAFVALIPSLFSETSQMSFTTLRWTLLGTLLAGLIWTRIAAGIAMKGRFLDGLKET